MMRRRGLWARCFALLALAWIAGCGADRRVRFYAAASLTETAQAVAEACASDPGVDVLPTIAGTSTLARQLLAGAPAGVFVSADRAWVDELERAGLVASQERYLRNSLVCVFATPVSGESWVDALRSADRIALADTENVPAGRYAREAMTTAEIWDELASRVVQSPDVRGALALVSRGDVEAAIVYATDAAAARSQHVLPVPATAHGDVEYFLVVMNDAPADADRLAEYLRGDSARAIFETAGFLPVTDD